MIQIHRRRRLTNNHGAISKWYIAESEEGTQVNILMRYKRGHRRYRVGPADWPVVQWENHDTMKEAADAARRMIRELEGEL